MPEREQFGGRIGRTLAESAPWWPEPHDHGDRPNVVVILFDDLGYSHFGCYGSTIATPNIDSLAAGGLRFTNFHVTPMCSPTRAALLTGRNPHTVGMRAIANFDSGFPHQRACITSRAATVAEMLHAERYATYALGKWHLNPVEEASAAGPFDHWPLQKGFDRFYGFLGPETDQFHPELTYDNHHIDPPATPDDGYHLTEDLVDRAQAFLRDHQSIRPQQPFLLYVGLGATHAPHQAPAEYIERYRGKFDKGWDAVREEWFARQLELGIIPPDTQLAPRNPGVEPWAELSDNARSFMARLQETFAGFLEHTDAQIGRLVRYLDESGQLDNTLLLILADNGASQEGGAQGVSDSERSFNQLPDDLDEVQSRLGEIGGPRSNPNFPWGWAQAGNTPLRWYKQNTHGGGVRVPLIAHWPRGISDRGGIRRQFHYVTDILPTILEAVGAEAPAEHRGEPQIPVAGSSLRYAFDDPEAESSRHVQYFEHFGHRGIWIDGWKAVTWHPRGQSFDEDEWELYDLATDFSETNNLAAEQPQRLREMIDAWWVEAGKHGVLPLDDRTGELLGPSRRPGGFHEAGRYSYKHPISHLPSDIVPPLDGHSWTISADIERGGTDDEGVLIAYGTLYGGYSLYIQANRLHFHYNALGSHTDIAADAELPAGRCTVSVSMQGNGIRQPGNVTLQLDGEQIGGGTVPMQVRSHLARGGDIGADRLSPVADTYDAPFEFSALIHQVDVEIQRKRSSSADAEARTRAILARQ